MRRAGVGYDGGMKMRAWATASFVTAAVAGGSVSAAPFTIAGTTFDDELTPTAASYAGPSGASDDFVSRFGENSPGVDQSKTIGRLLGFGSSGSVSYDIAGGDGNAGDRGVLTLDFTGLFNLPGQDDLVIYEDGSPEPFAVALSADGGLNFSAFRYEPFDDRDESSRVNAVRFDFADFGLAAVNAVRIVHLRSDDSFNSDGTIFFDDPTSGQTRVGDVFAADKLDADITYAAGIVPVPSPAAAMGGLVLLAGVALRRRRGGVRG